MFGQNNPLSSTWGQPQQNQQQQGTSAFGQPASTSTFGSGGAFGSGSSFGQQQPQQQQPQANPMFGGLGGTSTTGTAPASGFGAFGSANTAGTSGSGLFGQPKPATGFGTFGGTTNTGAFGGGGSTFGSGTTGTGMFGGGQQGTTTGAFGTGGGLFGQKPATGFNATTATPNTGSYDTVPPVTTGTSNPPYSVFTEEPEKGGTTNLQYQSITCLPAYRGSSFEELRAQDYQQGRKTAGAFGQPAFSAPTTQTTGTGLFGQQPSTNQPSTSMFGGFGGNRGASTSATGTTGFGAFGQPGGGTSTTGGGLFGGGGAFGAQQQQPQQQAGAFGAFGQPQPQPQQQQQAGTGGGMFGGGGAFGTNQPKPFGAFGSTGTTGAFSGGTGAFGTQQPQQGATTGTGLFGQQQQQPQQSTGAFGTFGSTAAQKPSIFGQPAQSTGFGAFGTQQQQGQQQGTQPSGGIFGTGGGLPSQQQQQPGTTQQTGGLFGTQQQQQPQQPSGGLFGSGGPTGGGIFGTGTAQQSGQQQQAGQTGFGIFGQKPATSTSTGGGLFGTGTFGQPSTAGTSTLAPQTSMFGAPLGQGGTQTTSAGFGTGGGLFGKPATPAGTQPAQQTGGLFGTGGGTSFFGSSLGGSAGLGQSAVQPQLTASIAQPISANLPIFSMLPPGPRVVNLEQPKKKSSLFVDVPTRSPVARLQLGYSPASSKLRGFTSTAMIPGTDGRPLGPVVSLTAGKPGVLSLSKAASSKSLLGADSFLGGAGGPSPGLGSGSRQSVKKLILDKKVEPSDLFSKSGAASKVTFNPALSIAARELEAATAAAATAPAPESPTPAARTQPAKTPNRFSAPAGTDLGKESLEKEVELQEGDYSVRPSLSDLKKRSFKELAETEGLVVGRVGYGEIEFLEKVDLTGLSKTSELLGDFIRFDDKECAVYPDCDEADKPPPGSGLNVRARITLLHCWPLDKATREPIKDEKHTAMVRHLKRLKVMKNTHFESYDNETGKWVFTVDHF